MTNEELIQSYRCGNKESLQLLLEQNKALIYKVAKKFFTGCDNAIDQEDLIQEGYIGLIKAIEKYDLNNEKRAVFVTYAFYWIYQRMNKYIRKRIKNDEISLNKPITNGEDTCELGDLLTDDTNLFEEIDQELDNKLLRQRLDMGMKSITLRQRNILHLLYGLDCEPCNYRETGEILNMKRERVRQEEHKALKQLRYNSNLQVYEAYFIEYKFINKIKVLDTGRIDKYDWGF